MILKALGKLPTAKQMAAFAGSSHFNGETFSNIEPTTVMRAGASYPKLLRDAMSRPKDTRPPRDLPSVRVDLHQLPDATPQMVWFGHSSYLISHNGYRILVDPVLFGTASPVSFIGKPFPITSPYTLADIPPIDLLVITHDHYDHLDFVTLTKIKDRIRRIVCPPGVSSHLRYWNFNAEIITELDWHTRSDITAKVSLTALPARHFSGRAFSRNHTLWNAYSLRLGEYRILLGGDSGYDAEFARIGQQLGPFDIAILECGQYGRDWPHIHMFPEETARAAIDLRAKQLLPVHWAKFVLANHSWAEPMERLTVAARDANFELLTPVIGSATPLRAAASTNAWWRDI